MLQFLCPFSFVKFSIRKYILIFVEGKCYQVDAQLVIVDY